MWRMCPRWNSLASRMSLSEHNRPNEANQFSFLFLSLYLDTHKPSELSYVENSSLSFFGSNYNLLSLILVTSKGIERQSGCYDKLSEKERTSREWSIQLKCKRWWALRELCVCLYHSHKLISHSFVKMCLRSVRNRVFQVDSYCNCQADTRWDILRNECNIISLK